MWRTDSLEKTLMLGKIEGGRGGERQRMSWLNGHEFEQALGERKPGVLQSMWLQRVRQHWAAQQVWDFIALIAQMLEVSLCSCWLMVRWLNCNNRQHLKDFWQQRCVIFWHCFNTWFFFYTPSNSKIPVGCPTIEFNSDTTYLETMSGPTGYGLSPTRMSPTPILCYFRCLLVIQVVTCASDRLTIDQRFQQPPFQAQLIC